MNLNNLNYALRSIVLGATLIGAVPVTVLAQQIPGTSSGKLPTESVYWLSVPLTDTKGKRFDLRDLAGHPVLVTMFYGDCNTACPIILENLQQTIAMIKPPAGKLSVLMVSLDPLHDNPASLAQLAQTHHLDKSVFRLAVSADEAHTRAMAAALNIKYRVLDNGEINHSTRVCLLDGAGRVIASSTQLTPAPDKEFVQQIRLALHTP